MQRQVGLEVERRDSQAAAHLAERQPRAASSRAGSRAPRVGAKPKAMCQSEAERSEACRS
jgi:hypothetical protein